MSEESTMNTRDTLLKFWPDAMMNPGRPELHVEIDLYSIIPFCGCGDPEEAGQWLLGLLKLLDVERWKLSSIEQDDLTARYKAHWLSVCKEEDGPLFYLVLYFLDSEGWTEHGSSVGGCWLTDKGKAAILALEALIEADRCST